MLTVKINTKETLNPFDELIEKIKEKQQKEKDAQIEMFLDEEVNHIQRDCSFKEYREWWFDENGWWSLLHGFAVVIVVIIGMGYLFGAENFPKRPLFGLTLITIGIGSWLGVHLLYGVLIQSLVEKTKRMRRVRLIRKLMKTDDIPMIEKGIMELPKFPCDSNLNEALNLLEHKIAIGRTPEQRKALLMDHLGGQIAVVDTKFFKDGFFKRQKARCQSMIEKQEKLLFNSKEQKMADETIRMAEEWLARYQMESKLIAQKEQQMKNYLAELRLKLAHADTLYEMYVLQQDNNAFLGELKSTAEGVDALGKEVPDIMNTFDSFLANSQAYLETNDDPSLLNQLLEKSGMDALPEPSPITSIV